MATDFASATSTPLSLLCRGRLGRSLLTTPDRGAETLARLADGVPGRDWRSGRCYEKKKPARTSRPADDDVPVEALWVRSAELVGLQPAVGSDRAIGSD